jgi:tetratricopeptide (TPR) repeat protein
MITEFAYLRDLARTIRTHFPTRSQIVRFDSTEDVHATMFSGLLDDSLADESSLRARMSGEGYASNSYLVERNQLKEKLFNMLFMLKLTKANASQYRIASLENSRAIFIAQALRLFGLRGFATRTIRKGLADATKFEFTAHRLLFLQLLREEASVAGNKQVLTGLHRMTAEVLELLGAEFEAAQLSEELSALLAVTGSRNQAIVTKSKAVVDGVKVLFEHHDTFNIGLEYFTLSALSLEVQGRYTEAIKMCDSASRFLRDHPQFDSPSFYASLAFRKLDCALHARKYDDALEAAAECKRLYAPGNQIWFVFMEALYFLQMQRCEFELAKATLLEVTLHKRFGILTEHRTQRWALYGFYLEYAQGKYTDRELAKQRLATLRRMIYSTPDYGRDKAGFNLAIVILDFLILLETRQYGELSEDLEALQKYRQRHLQDDPEASRYVLLLIEIARNVDSLTAIKLAGRAFTKSGKRRTPPLLLHASERLEILPYDWMAAKILKQIQEDLADQPTRKNEVKPSVKRKR